MQLSPKSTSIIKIQRNGYDQQARLHIRDLTQ